MHPLMNARQQGVRVPEAQTTGQAPAMTILNIANATFKMVQWSDERGMVHDSLAAIVGDKVFVNEGWTTGFRSMTEAMGKQVFEKIEAQEAAKSPAVPKEDTVDVMGSKGEVVSGGGIDVFDTPKSKGK